jgi:colanic acid/amylovoran biosynthesis glycosyltransferase
MGQVVVNLGCPEEKIRVIHLGIPVADIPFEPRRWKPGDTLRVLIAASFREKKGIPYALQALARLQEKVELQITIIGDAGDDPGSQKEKANILRTIRSCGAKERVRLLGYQPHAVLHEEARKHHIFLSPSVTAASGDMEGGAPVSIIEMAASGIPVVSTKHCDIPGVIQHGVTGLLAEERDVDGLVNRLEWLLANPQKWSVMVAASRKHIEAKFDACTQGKRLASLYEELTGSARSGAHGAVVSEA